MFETILIVVLVLAAIIMVLLIVVAMQASAFRVSRSASIKAAPADVFVQVNDLHNMNEWSPWLAPDPQIKITYEGPPAGAGAAFSWNGNSEVGEGRLTIIDSRPNDVIRIKLDFKRPFASTADTEFTFKPDGDQTVVTWTMTGQKIFMTKLFGLVMSMDKMIGGNFEKGLATMKTRVEAHKVTI